MREASRPEVVIASPLLRVAAFLIDALILVGINLVVIGSLGGISERDAFIVTTVVGTVYHIGFVTARSATPGKMIVGTRICDREGNALRPDTAILRYLAFLIGNAILVGTLVSLVLLVTDPRRRTVHDRVAGTLVVMAPRPAEDAGPRF